MNWVDDFQCIAVEASHVLSLCPGCPKHFANDLQVPRTDGSMHGKDLLAFSSQSSGGWLDFEGEIQKRNTGEHHEHKPRLRAL